MEKELEERGEDDRERRNGRPAGREPRGDQQDEDANLIGLESLSGELARYFQKRVPRPAVDDLVGVVLLQTVQAWMRGGGGGTPRNFRALALKVARDAAAEFHRREKRRAQTVPLSGAERDQEPSDASHRLRAALERMLLEARPLLTDRQRTIADGLFSSAPCSAVARRMSMRLRDLEAALLEIATKIRRSSPEIYPPSDG